MSDDLFYLPGTVIRPDVDLSMFGSTTVIDLGDDPNGDLYCYQIRKPEAVVSYSYAHSVLGHPGRRVMKKMEKLKLVGNLNWSWEDSDKPCIPCELSNSRRPDRTMRGHVAEAKGAVVYADIQTVTAPTFWGAKYAVMFVDSYSRFARVYILKRKSDVDDALESYISFCKSCGVTISKMKTDAEPCFMGEECKFRKVCEKHAIMQEQSPPYCHWANGVVERLILTILRKAFAMIAQSGAPNGLWGRAVMHATALYCLTSHSSMNDYSPYHRWYGKPATGEYLHIWGCKAVVNTPPELRSNFVAPPAKKGRYVGFSSWEAMSTHVIHVYSGHGQGKIVRSGQCAFYEEMDDEAFLDAVRNDDLLRSWLGGEGDAVQHTDDLPTSPVALAPAAAPIATPVAPEVVPIVHAVPGDVVARGAANAGEDVVEPVIPPNDFKLRKVMQHRSIVETVEDGSVRRVAVVYGQLQLLDGSFALNWYRIQDLIRLSGTYNVQGNWLVLGRYIKQSIGDEYDEILFRSFRVKKESNSRSRKKRPQIFRVIAASYCADTDVISAVYPDGNIGEGKRARFTALQLVKIPPSDFDFDAHAKETYGREDLAASGFGMDSWIPKTFDDVLLSGDSLWEYATYKEVYQLLYEVCGARLVKLKEMNGPAISSRFVYEIKMKNDMAQRCCRFTPRGFAEIPGVHYDPEDIFASSPQLYMIRYLCATAAGSGRKIYHADCKRAFSTTPFKDGKTLLVKLPKGFELRAPDGDLCGLELVNSVYGLKESNSDWEKRLRAALEGMGYKSSIQSVTTYVMGGTTILCWVDDLFILPPLGTDDPDAFCADLCNDLAGRLGTKVDNRGVLKSALGLEFSWTDLGCSISQEHYIDECLEAHNMTDVRPRRVPVDPNFDLQAALDSPPLGPEHKTMFCSVTGKILWAHRCIFPEIAWGVHVCSRYMHAPTEGLLKAAHEVLAYLKHVKSQCLTYSSRPCGGMEDLLSETYGYDPTEPTGFCDSQWKQTILDDARIDNRCYNFCVIMFNHAAIDWRISVAKRVSLSAPEAELYALTRMAQLMAACRRIFEDIGVDAQSFLPFLAFSDSKGAVSQGTNPVANSALVHLDNKTFFCREQKETGQIHYKWVSRKVNPADIGTHIMADHPAFERFTAFLKNTGIVKWSRERLAVLQAAIFGNII
jgi:hypothetical protein